MAIIVGNALSIFILLIKTRTDTKNIFSFIQKAIFNMKNKEFYKLLKKNKFKPNSGFTLTELLVGLIMGTIVIAGAGWGLMNILRTTRTETNKTASRNETSRAFNFIADEIKASQSMDVLDSSFDIDTVAPGFRTNTGEAEDTVKLSLRVPGVDQRIVYYVIPSTGSWKKPLTIYRWGPNLKTDGSYSNPTEPDNWTEEALIDGISDETLTADGCDVDGDNSDEAYQGFYACVVDDDGDTTVDASNNPIAENADSNGDGRVLARDLDENNDGTIDFFADIATVDVNGDGIVNSADLDINQDGEIDLGDNADNDGVSITAQLYFATAAKKDDSGNVKESYQTKSQVVARSRVAPLRKPALTTKKLLEVESLPFEYGRNNCWTVRNDFGQGDDPTARPDSGNELTNTMTWIHEDDRQPQPLNIDTDKPFTIVASAFGGRNPLCLARGNEYQRVWDGNEYKYLDSNGDPTIDDKADGETRKDFSARMDASNAKETNGSEKIHTYRYKVWHTIDFSNPDTFNGEESNVGSNVTSSDSNPRGDGTVRIYKNGDTISDYLGYDENNDGNSEQPSIREHLENNSNFVENGVVVNLEPNQRIIAFEIGQDNSENNPGFDLQDAIFIMTSDAFTD